MHIQSRLLSSSRMEKWLHYWFLSTIIFKEFGPIIQVVQAKWSINELHSKESGPMIQGIWTHYSSGLGKVKHKWAPFQGILTHYSHHYYLAVEVKLIDASGPIKMKHIWVLCIKVGGPIGNDQMFTIINHDNDPSWSRWSYWSKLYMGTIY